MEKSHTILLVDDEMDALEPMEMLLMDDFRVLTASGGEQALEVMDHEDVQLIIADQRMPGMTGVELLARVRELYPRCVRLILTAYTDFEAMLTAINEGRVYRYVIKPWDPDDMLVTIRQALEFRDLMVEKGKLSAEIAEAHRDLAERTRQLQAAQETIIRGEKLAAVGRFAAEMTHEINNHLQVILGVSTMDGIYDEHERHGIIEDQARLLHGITQDIRDFALGARMPFSPREEDPVKVCRDVIRTCTHHPAFRSVDIRLEHGASRECSMDVRQFKHLLFNLLKNASHASPSGAIIDVNLVVADHVTLTVSDHGKGVDEQIRQRIWEPFFTTEEETGTGLGLSICKRVVEAHGGTIDLDETLGGGATFVVRLPLERQGS